MLLESIIAEHCGCSPALLNKMSFHFGISVANLKRMHPDKVRRLKQQYLKRKRGETVDEALIFKSGFKPKNYDEYITRDEDGTYRIPVEIPTNSKIWDKIVKALEKIGGYIDENEYGEEEIVVIEDGYAMLKSLLGKLENLGVVIKKAPAMSENLYRLKLKAGDKTIVIG